MKKILKFLPEIIIFSFAAITRFINLGKPSIHVFDEVYHAFTAQQIAKNNPAAWEWWNSPPPGFAFEWTHPPLAKEFMVMAIYIFGDTTFAWRFFSAFFSGISIVLIYLITLKLFKSRVAALVAGLVASLDGLLLVMGRIAMNDSYLVFFSLLAIYLYLNNRKFLTVLSLGLAISSKWTGVFVILAILSLEIYKYLGKKLKLNELIKNSLILFSFPLVIYLLSYIPFFLGKHVPPGTSFNIFETFIELQRQMFFYHWNLGATHPYQSKPLVEWILNLRPVWLFVEYKDSMVGNIYTLGNPLFMWGGLISIFILICQFIKRQTFNIFIVWFCYLLFFLPWAISPRIMFNYHYLLSASFLAIAQGVVISQLIKINKGKLWVFLYLILMAGLFIYFYPLWTGLAVDKNLSESYFWFKSWK